MRYDTKEQASIRADFVLTKGNLNRSKWKQQIRKSEDGLYEWRLRKEFDRPSITDGRIYLHETIDGNHYFCIVVFSYNGLEIELADHSVHKSIRRAVKSVLKSIKLAIEFDPRQKPIPEPSLN